LAVVRWHEFYSSSDGIAWTRLSTQPGGLTPFACPSAPTSEDCPLYRGELAVVPPCCGGGGGGAGQPGTPSGDYTITVNATMGSITHSTQASLSIH
jgi:hypothetical protein